MNPEALIEEVARRLAVAAPGARVILFGSRARGEERPNSDLDLLVIVKILVDFLKKNGKKLLLASIAGMFCGVILNFSFPDEIEVVGQVVGVAMSLDPEKRRRIRS